MPNTKEETTLILLKPDCVRKNLSGTILKRFLSEGFRLRGIKMIQLDEPVLRERHMLFLPLVEIRRENPVESPVLYFLH